MQATRRPRDLACLPGPRRARTPAAPAPREPDQRPFRIYTRDPQTRLLVHDGLIYRGQRLAHREAAKITRLLGEQTEVRPAT
jgi:hypothetical protein